MKHTKKSAFDLRKPSKKQWLWFGVALLVTYLLVLFLAMNSDASTCITDSWCVDASVNPFITAFAYWVYIFIPTLVGVPLGLWIVSWMLEKGIAMFVVGGE